MPLFFSFEIFGCILPSAFLVNGIGSATDNVVAMFDDTIKALGNFGDDAGSVAKIIDNTPGFDNTLAKNSDDIFQFAENTSKITGSTIKSLEEFADILTRYSNKNIYDDNIENILTNLINKYGSEEVKQATDTWGYKLIEEARRGNTAKVTEYINNPIPFDYSTLKNTGNFSSEALEHIFTGQYDGKKASGFHYKAKNANGDYIIPNCKGTLYNENPRLYNESTKISAYEVNIDGMKKSGISTFFPDYWTPQETVDAINEAFNNVTETISDLKIKGKTKDGTTTEILIKRGKIEDAYPDIKNNNLTKWNG